MSKDYINVAFETEQAVTDEVRKQTREFFKLLQDKIGELTWQVANDYIESHLDSDVIVNYQDQVRQEVVRCSHIWCRNPDSSWGKSLRAKLFEEHKDEILPLIRNERIEQLEKDLAVMTAQFNFQVKLNSRIGY